MEEKWCSVSFVGESFLQRMSMTLFALFARRTKMKKLEYAVREAVYDWENKEETPWLPHPEYTDIQMKRIGPLWLYVQQAFTKDIDDKENQEYSWTVQKRWDGFAIASSIGNSFSLSEATAKECAEAVARIINKEMKEKANV